MQLINVFSCSNVLSHDLEIIHYFNDKFKIKINYYFLSSQKDQIKNYNCTKNNNLKIFFNIDKFTGYNNFNPINIFFNYIPNNKLINKVGKNSRLIFIGNIFNLTGNNSNIKKIDIFNFYRLADIEKEYKNNFLNAKINNIYNINYPSGIKCIDWLKNTYSIEYIYDICDIYYPNRIRKIDGVKNDYSDEYMYDIVIPLGGWLDYVLIDKIIKKIGDKRILIIGKNNPHECVTSNIDLIKIWGHYKNVNLINMVNLKELYLLLKLSKIGILPFNINIKRDITRIADFIFLGKIILTTKIDANKNIENLVFCESLNDYLLKINYYLKNNRYNNKEKYNQITKYYNDNFRIKLILDKIFK